MTSKKQISIIVAIAEDNGIGKDNQLLWHLSDDLKHFKAITSGHTVVMGKNTYESLPFKPLPKRKNIVITDVAGEIIDSCEMAYSIEEAIDKMDADSENFVIGGASIYRQFFNIADKLYITKVLSKPEADTFFPKIKDTEWSLQDVSETFTDNSNGLSFMFLEFLRKQS